MDALKDALVCIKCIYANSSTWTCMLMHAHWLH